MEETNPIEIERVQLGTKLETLTEKATAVCERLKNETAAAAKAADKALRQHPYQATGIAFGLGILIGVLVTRSRCD